jgi:hypothetical protein
MTAGLCCVVASLDTTYASTLIGLPASQASMACTMPP